MTYNLSETRLLLSAKSRFDLGLEEVKTRNLSGFVTNRERFSSIENGGSRTDADQRKINRKNKRQKINRKIKGKKINRKTKGKKSPTLHTLKIVYLSR